jgi:hypothetical protein
MTTEQSKLADRDVILNYVGEPVAWRWRHSSSRKWDYAEEKPEGPSIHLFEVEPLYATPSPAALDPVTAEALFMKARDYIRENVKEAGGCDHSVGICMCADISLINEFNRAIQSIRALSQPAPAGGAAISRRDWRATELAYEAIRDKFYESEKARTSSDTPLSSPKEWNTRLMTSPSQPTSPQTSWPYSGEDFCITHGREHMRSAMGNPIPWCQVCEEERETEGYSNPDDEDKHETSYPTSTAGSL